jgi:hypothetical protein
VTRVTSGVIVGDLDVVIGLAGDPRQVGDVRAAMLPGVYEQIAFRRGVRMERAMCAGTRLGFGIGRHRRGRFFPWLGGVEELSGVFGGRPSLASSSAIRASAH